MNRTTYNIVLIGAKSTGKTVYLTALYLLPFIRVTDEETLKYLKPLKEMFEKRDIPATNAGYQELFFEYKKGDFNLRFQIDDYDGKFAEQFSSDENKELKKKLEENIKRAEGMMFFLPYEENLDNQKAENIREEIDIFIEKVRQLYPNKKDLPIPVAIIVTKWDESPYFKSSNEVEKAKEYIENNEILKNIKEKIETFFSNTTLIPISSYEQYNLDKPLEFCFLKTFEEWEKRIEELKNDKFKLLCFLSKIIDDIKFYKNGEYKKLYESLENEIYNKIFEKLKNSSTLEEFSQIIEQYKLENGTNIINCLTPIHIEEIKKIENELYNKKKMKNIKIGISIGIIIILIIGGVIFVNYKKKKDILYTEIVTSYKTGNVANTLNLIQKYKSKFGKDEKNYPKVVKIENEILSKCKSDIQNKLNKLENITSLEKKVDLYQSIKNEANLCDVSLPEKETLAKLQEDYNNLIDLINQLSIENLTDDVISQISLLLTEIQKYDEYNYVMDLLNKKLETLANALLESSNEEDAEKIKKLIDFISQVNINNPQLVEKLNNKYAELNSELAYQSFKDGLDSLEYLQAVQYVKNNYQEAFSSKKNEIIEMLNRKLANYINDIINNAPVSIDNETDLEILKQKIDAIDNALNQTIDLINYTPYIDTSLENKINDLKNLYDKYNGGVTVTYIAFSADSENNKPLKFDCTSTANHNGNIILHIADYTYRWDEGANCDELTISWNKGGYFNTGYYNVEVIEKDIWPNPDDKYSSFFQLTRNDIIDLINGNQVDKDIGNGYHIILGTNQ